MSLSDLQMIMHWALAVVSMLGVLFIAGIYLAGRVRYINDCLLW